MPSVARGTFDVELTPGTSELDGSVARFDLAKTFHGDLKGTGRGLMLSGGDPGAGEAGYVAIETVTGRLHSHDGNFALQQFGTMHGGERMLHYEVVPGSGGGGLAGIGGTFTLEIDSDGTHRYELEYELDPNPS